ncbi:MAG: ATP-dependent zinc metalloprotease FtsH [Actinomycetia bacterium]|nr:ATP-dependent zinc metalloprotease FtsH [Actinomycetes bacterium]
MSKQGSTPPPTPEKGNQGVPGRSEGGWPRWSAWIVVGILIALLAAAGTLNTEDSTEVAYTDLLADIENGEVESIKYDNTNAGITGVRTDGETFRTTGPSPIPDEHLALIEAGDVEIVFETPTGNFFLNLLPLFLPFLIIIGFFWWMARRQQSQMGGIMSIGRSKAKTYSSERPGTSFSDVAGYASVKKEITEVVDFLKEPAKFAEIGARIPKGVLLVGPPGTGKTLIARAVAGEAGVPFLSVTGSDFMEMFVGVGASRVRDLFNEARKMGRAIIFVDEIDSIGRKRGAGLGGGHDEREQTLNQMLSEMDGFEATEGIVMMAATNRPDILDPALLRPGRFDRQVVVPLPELDDRKEILAVHIKHKRMAEDVDVDVIARGTPGMSGADLANLVNEAALFAVRNGESKVHARHFDMARDRVIMGVKRDSLVMSESEREMTAYHEAGHALCAAVLPEYDPLHKVTIIPTGMALGVTMTLPEEDRHSIRRSHAENMIVMMLGGRNAEDLVFGVVSSGAGDDLQKATGLARRMVREWGMSDKVGPMAFGGGGPVFLGEDMLQSKEYSEDVASLIDTEIQRLLINQEVRCRQLLTDNRKALNLIARGLLEHETLSGTEVNRLIRVAGGHGDTMEPAGDSIPPIDDTVSSSTSSFDG